MEYPSRCRSCFPRAGAMPAESANRLERLDLFLHGHSRAAAQRLFWAQARIETSFHDLRLPSGSWDWSCGRAAFADRTRCRGMGRAPELLESPGFTVCVHGINHGGRDIFSARDRRVSCRQTTNGSETYFACAVDGTRAHRRSLWRMPLRGCREIIA